MYILLNDLGKCARGAKELAQKEKICRKSPRLFMYISRVREYISSASIPGGKITNKLFVIYGFYFRAGPISIKLHHKQKIRVNPLLTLRAPIYVYNTSSHSSMLELQTSLLHSSLTSNDSINNNSLSASLQPVLYTPPPDMYK